MHSTKAVRGICYEQLINLLESVPEDYRDKVVAMSQNWNDRDFFAFSFERLDRKSRIILAENKLGCLTVDGLINALKAGANRCMNAPVSLRLGGTKFTNYYIIENLNFSYGQDAIYIELHRLG